MLPFSDRAMYLAEIWTLSLLALVHFFAAGLLLGWAIRERRRERRRSPPRVWYWLKWHARRAKPR